MLPPADNQCGKVTRPLKHVQHARAHRIPLTQLPSVHVTRRLPAPATHTDPRYYQLLIVTLLLLIHWLHCQDRKINIWNKQSFIVWSVNKDTSSQESGWHKEMSVRCYNSIWQSWIRKQQWRVNIGSLTFINSQRKADRYFVSHYHSSQVAHKTAADWL